ncbi:MAG: 1-deoxy-D-xylulose-5-phosphate reductoisomerase [Bosea sp. (in: a-proteobacteria)]
MNTRKVSILGATGSVGRTCLAVMAENTGVFEVVALVGGRDVAALAHLARETKAQFAAVADAQLGLALSEALADSGIASGAGREAVRDAAAMACDISVSAISGVAGLEPTWVAIEQGQAVALANKESLVCAGQAVMAHAQACGTTILPLDSEHNALLQALGGQDPASISKMTITASGGPFRTWSAGQIAQARLEDALKHPNWVMGQKITIDSATLMNKGLELIEAAYLFGLEADRLDVVVHPQSIIHGMVHFADGSVSAGLAMPDMRVPAAHCLSHGLGRRLQAPDTRQLDLASLGSLTFEKPDLVRFPALRLAWAALRAGGAMTAILNAANEVAVAAFLERRISFPAISALVETVCERLASESIAAPASLDEALAVDHVARNMARALLPDQVMLAT